MECGSQAMLNGPRAMPSNLPLEGGGHVGAVLLQANLRVDAAFLELALDELEGVDDVVAVAGGDVELRLETPGEAGLGQQAPRFLHVVPVVLRAGAELIDARRPLGQPARDRGSKWGGS